MTIDELEAIRALRTNADPAAAARDAAAERLRERILGGGPRRRPPLLAVVLASAVVAIVVLFLVAVRGGEERDARPRPATLGETKKLLVARGLAPGEYWYVEDRSRYMSSTAVGDQRSYSLIQPSRRQTWTNRAGSGRWVIRNDGPPQFLSDRDRQRWEAAGKRMLGLSRRPQRQSFRNQEFSFGSRSLSFAQLSALPRDGRRMYERLIEGAGDAGASPDEEAFVMIGDLLRSAPVPPGVRRGLYRATEHIKGVRLVGDVRDPLGRPGIAVELDSADRRQRLIFAPESYLLLAEQDRLLRRVEYIDAEPGTIIGERVAVRQGIVRDDRSLPPG